MEFPPWQNMKALVHVGGYEFEILSQLILVTFYKGKDMKD
jgi:hypothetical protein